MRELPAPLRDIPRDVPGLWAGLQERFADLGRPPRVVIHGGYGKNNMGDDSILHVIRGRVLAAFPNAEIHVVCHGPERIVERYRNDAGGPVTSSYFKSRETIRAAHRADVYIIGGGSIVNRINSYSGNMVFKVLDPKGKFQFLTALFSNWTGGFTIFYAIGAESFPDVVVRILTRLALNRADVVSVRDPNTVENLRKIGVNREIVHVLDPAISLVPADPAAADALLVEIGLPPRAQRTRPLVGVNFRWVGDPAIDNEKTLSEAVRLVRDLDKRGCDVIFLPTSHYPQKPLEDDVDFGTRLRDALGAPAYYTLLDRYPHPTVFMALFGACDALVVSRFHAVVFGTMMGVPVAVVSYDDKVAGFVRLSEQTSRLIDLSEFTLERLTPVLDEMLAAAGRA
jgi:polysaccharide pyruvyl transferase WcaK-like protein